MTPRLWREVGLSALVGAVLLFTVAAFLYHGGSYTGEHFSWSSSFISDLGLSQSYNGRNQLLVRLLAGGGFVLTSTTIISVVFYITSADLPNRTDHVARDLAIILAFIFVLIAVFPADTHLAIHRGLLASVVLLSAVIWPLCFARQKFTTIISRATTYVTTLTIWAYLLFLLFAPRPEVSVAASNVHAQFEKFVFVLAFWNIYVLFTERQEKTMVKKHHER